MLCDWENTVAVVNRKVTDAWADWLCQFLSPHALFCSFDFARKRSERGAVRCFIDYLYMVMVESRAYRLFSILFIDRGNVDHRVHPHAFIDHARLPPEQLERLWAFGRADIAGAHGKGARIYLGQKATRGEGFDALIDGKVVVQDVILRALADARGPQNFLQLSLRMHLRTAEGVHLKPDVNVMGNNLDRLIRAGKVRPARAGGRRLWTLTPDTAATMGVLGPESAPQGRRSH
jgi:hypothetical protein